MSQLSIDELTTLDDYQLESQRTAVYPKHLGVLYTIMGVMGEAGELGAVLKSLIDRGLQEDPNFDSDDLQTVRDAIETAVAACSVVETLKKKARKGLLTINPVPKPSENELAKICSEGGDGLWYAAGTAAAAGVTLTDVARMNIRKLRERRESNTLVSQGETVAERLAAIRNK